MIRILARGPLLLLLGLVAGADEEAEVRLHGEARFALAARLDGHDRATWEVRFLPGGRRLLSSGWDGRLKIWGDAPPWRLLAAVDAGVGDAWGLDVHPRRAEAAVGGLRRIAIVDLEKRAVTRRLEGHRHHVYRLRYTPDGTRLLSCSNDGVRIWKTADWEQERFLPSDGTVSALDVHPGGALFAAGDEKGLIRLHDLESGEVVRTLGPHDHGFDRLCFHPKGHVLAASGLGRLITLWNPKTGRRVGVLRGHLTDVAALTFSADGRWLLSGGHDTTWRLWDFRRRRQVQAAASREGDVMATAFSPDGETMVTGRAALRVWTRD